MKVICSDRAREVKAVSSEVEKERIASRQVIEELLANIYGADTFHSQYCPRELANEIIGKIPSIDGKILVMYDIMLLWEVIRRKNGQGLNDVYFICSNKMKGEFVHWLGISKMNIMVIPVSNVKSWLDGMKGKELNMKFDVIVGNPPYQEESKNKKGESSKAAKRLWESFVEMSLSSLTKNGYLAYVTPSGWISKTSSTNKILCDREFIFANLSSKISSYFNGAGGSMRFTYFVIKNCERKTIPIFEFDDGKFQLDVMNFTFTPTKSSFGLDYTITEKILSSNDPVLSWLRREVVKKAIPKLEVAIHRTKTPSYKIILQKDGKAEGYITFPNSIKTGEIIAHNLNLKLYQRFRWTMRTGMALVSSITQLPIPIDKKYSDAELYKHFKLTKEEIKLIEDTVK